MAKQLANVTLHPDFVQRVHVVTDHAFEINIHTKNSHFRTVIDICMHEWFFSICFLTAWLAQPGSEVVFYKHR